MKSLIVLLVFLLSAATQASLAGKYKIEFSNGLSGMSGEYVFLMNSDLEVKELSDEGEYNVWSFDAAPFFGEVELTVRWGSDEETHYFVMNLVEEKGVATLSKSCGVYNDVPSDYVTFDEAYSVVKKWNKSKKKYETVKVNQSVREEAACLAKLNRLLD